MEKIHHGGVHSAQQNPNEHKEQSPHGDQVQNPGAMKSLNNNLGSISRGREGELRSTLKTRYPKSTKTD